MKGDNEIMKWEGKRKMKRIRQSKVLVKREEYRASTIPRSLS